MGVSIDIRESLVVALATMKHYKRIKIDASASRIVKRKSVAQQDDKCAPPFKKMKTKRQFLPYEEAKKVVNALGLKNRVEWYRWSCAERPPDIPSCPSISYKNAGWNGFADWLGQPNEQIYTYVIEGTRINEIVKLDEIVKREV